MSTPLVGVTLDVEGPGGFSQRPWYALRKDYADAITRAGGAAVFLPHDPGAVDTLCDRLDALVIAGGAFDIDPKRYGAGTTHASVSTKPGRTSFEEALLLEALTRDMPVLGICGGMQLLAVLAGSTLHQHIPDALPDALNHEQDEPPDLPCHGIDVAAGTQLAEIVAPYVTSLRMHVNSTHHQAVAEPGRSVVVSARATDGVIEAIELPRKRFAIGVQWHPEVGVDPGDRAIFRALVQAARSVEKTGRGARPR
jgi:putative glutamine amidotransferase